MILNFWRKIKYSVDWLLLGSLFFIAIAGVLTMNSFAPGSLAMSVCFLKDS